MTRVVCRRMISSALLDAGLTRKDIPLKTILRALTKVIAVVTYAYIWFDTLENNTFTVKSDSFHHGNTLEDDDKPSTSSIWPELEDYGTMFVITSKGCNATHGLTPVDGTLPATSCLPSGVLSLFNEIGFADSHETVFQPYFTPETESHFVIPGSRRDLTLQGIISWAASVLPGYFIALLGLELLKGGMQQSKFQRSTLHRFRRKLAVIIVSTVLQHALNVACWFSVRDFFHPLEVKKQHFPGVYEEGTYGKMMIFGFYGFGTVLSLGSTLLLFSSTYCSCGGARGLESISFHWSSRANFAEGDSFLVRIGCMELICGLTAGCAAIWNILAALILFCINLNNFIFPNLKDFSFNFSRWGIRLPTTVILSLTLSDILFDISDIVTVVYRYCKDRENEACEPSQESRQKSNGTSTINPVAGHLEMV